MYRTLKLALNKYPTVPHTLRANPAVNAPLDTFSVSLANLYHHYYLDSYGILPPNPDPAQFEHIRFLMPTPDFRLHGSGIGIAPAIKRHRSNELGQAFCRWFLHDHFNITYFAHMEDVLDRQLHRAFEGCRIERKVKGDTPDYFCAESVVRVFLAEAKGRYRSVSFKTKEFDQWRKQFTRITFLDGRGSPLSIKGHIVAVRYATEQDGPRVRSSIFAEDPMSPGESPLDSENADAFGSAVIALHYAVIAAKLRQPQLAASLATGVALPDELRVLAVAWRVLAGPLAGRRFIGGYFGPPDSGPRVRKTGDKAVFEWPPPLRLDAPSATFFGVEETIFKRIVSMARTGLRATSQMETFEETGFFYSGFSTLRDGSALGPVEFFHPEHEVVL